MEAYRYLAKMGFMKSLTYRFDLFASMLCQVLIMLAGVYLWRSAYANHATLNGLTKDQMVTYTVLAVVESTLFISGVEDSMSDGVYSGGIGVYFLRPASMLGMFFANDMGDMVSAVFVKTIPGLVFGVLLFRILPPISAVSLLLSLISLVFSILIIWIMAAFIGIFTLWAMKLGNLGYLKNTVIAFLSGAMIPLWFFPKGLQNVLYFSPFPYTYQAPLAIYIGQTGPGAALRVIATQIFWLVLLFALLNWTWSRGRQRVMVQGG